MSNKGTQSYWREEPMSALSLQVLASVKYLMGEL